MSNTKLKHELLRGPLAKIERANKHINDLNGKVSEYLSGSPFQLRIRQSNNPPQRFIFFQAKRSIPNDFSLILGDAVHNLRTALDQLCFGMVGRQAKNTRQVGFPFVEKADRLEGAIATRQMNIAPKDVIDEIKALQPYPSGNKYLHAVKAIDERDKHHFVVTVGLGVEMSVAYLQKLIGPNSGIQCDDPHNTFVATVGEFMVHLELDVPVEAFDKIADDQPLFTIGFGEGEALVSAPIIPAMEEMALATEDAVRRLAAAFFR